MKTIKAFIMVAFMGLAIGVSAQNKGKQQPTAESMAKHQTEMMKKQLNLTADQETKVQAINLKYAQQQMDKAKSHGDVKSMTDEQKKQWASEAKTIATQKDTEVKAVLTADQYQKYEAAKTKMKERAKEHRAQKQAETKK